MTDETATAPSTTAGVYGLPGITAEPDEQFIKAHKWAREANDWYLDPPWVTEAFLRAGEQFNGTILDPCCGCGNIPRAIKAVLGVDAMASDLIDRGYGRTGIDFAGNFAVEDTIDNIIFNPPFKHAEAFVERARQLARFKVAALLPLSFLETEGRAGFFDKTPPARVWVSRRRVSMPPGDLKAKLIEKAEALCQRHIGTDQNQHFRDELDRTRNTDAVTIKGDRGYKAFAWFVWTRQECDYPQIRWF